VVVLNGEKKYLWTTCQKTLHLGFERQDAFAEQIALTKKL